MIIRALSLNQFPATTFYDSLAFFAFSSGIVSLYVSLKASRRILGILGLVPAALLIPTLFMEPPRILLPPALRSYWLPIHSTLSLLGYGAFSVSFVASVLYIIRDREIRRKRGIHGSSLPALETIDRVNYLSLAVGFPLLTLGIITGSFWAEKAWGSYWSWDPKETWSLISWLIYAACIHQRFAIGWRGRRGAYLAIIGFLSIVFSFFVVNLLFKGLHVYAG